jgi:two-component system sensor histidine kinase VicK
VVSLSSQLHADCVRILVSDQGPGIPADFAGRIFEKFSQADASDRRQKGGTGLGLAISKELIERMGGRIGFDSVPGQGSTFWVELPLDAAAEA